MASIEFNKYGIKEPSALYEESHSFYRFKKEAGDYLTGLRFRIKIPENGFTAEAREDQGELSYFYLPDGGLLPTQNLLDEDFDDGDENEMEVRQLMYMSGNKIAFSSKPEEAQKIYGIFIPPYIDDADVPPPPK
ncbi:MAG TPA: hypothetical protein VLF89_05535 [Candidatus Saccharimonadales bacterium]|nr:hypothetical protein [Candidatus Saccharimonadales bacterium]